MRSLLEVLVRPLVELVERRGRAGHAYVKVLARLYADRRGFAQELAMSHFGDTLGELGERLVEAAPHVSRNVLGRRIALCSQAVLDTLASPQPFAVTEEAPAPTDPREIAAELLDFLEGGLVAPITTREADAA